jgi:hypothetical protein
LARSFFVAVGFPIPFEPAFAQASYASHLRLVKLGSIVKFLLYFDTPVWMSLAACVRMCGLTRCPDNIFPF